jgi:hypothetical protein
MEFLDEGEGGQPGSSWQFLAEERTCQRMKMLQRRRSPLEERVHMNPHVGILDDWSVIVLYYTHQNHTYRYGTQPHA